MSTSSPTKTAMAENKDLATGRKAILTEMEGLKALADSLDDNFAKAVDAIHTMKTARKSRLIVAGIGKSGHVGGAGAEQHIDGIAPPHRIATFDMLEPRRHM